MFFSFSLDYFVLVLFALVVFGFMSSVLAKRLSGKNVSEMTYFGWSGTISLTVVLLSVCTCVVL